VPRRVAVRHRADRARDHAGEANGHVIVPQTHALPTRTDRKVMDLSWYQRLNKRFPDAKVVRVQNCVFPILADPDKNNLQSTQLLIGREVVPIGWMAVVHLFSQLFLSGSAKIGETAIHESGLEVTRFRR